MPSLKIRTANYICWNSLGLFRNYGLDHIFLGIKLFFVFQDRKLKLSASVWNWISWNLTKCQLIQTIVIFIFYICCLIELKFCEVSRNYFSNRCWKFQLSILKNKKNIPKKNVFFKRLSLNMPQSAPKVALAVLIFSEGFAD